VHDRVRARQRLDRLSVVGEVGPQQRHVEIGEVALVARAAGIVDSDDVVVVLEQVSHDGPAGLSVGTGDRDGCHLCS